MTLPRDFAEQERRRFWARKQQEHTMNTTYFDNALHVMEVRGGSFVKSLANCYYAADSSNKVKLRAAFPKYFDDYEAQFQAWKAEQAQKVAA